MNTSFARSIKVVSIAVILLTLFSFAASADETTPDALPNLLSEKEDSSIEGRDGLIDPRHPEVIRERTADVDFSLLTITGRSATRPDQPDFLLNFFEDAQFEAFISYTETYPNGAIGLVGTVNSEEYNELVMVSNQGYLQAYLQVGNQLFEIRASENGHQIAEVDQSAYPDSAPPATLPQPDESEIVEPDLVAAADSGDIIDVLAVYTPATISYLGSTAAVQTRIQQSILSANTGYADSGINQRLNLVAMEQVSYDENPAGVSDANRWYYALDRLTTGQAYDGDAIHLTDARTYRDQYGADVVFMVTNLPYIYCGLGWLGGKYPTNADNGFSVLHVNCTGTGNYSVQHEMGHNMGSCHDWLNTSSTARPYCYDDYSYGYQQISGGFYTVMAYPDGCTGCTRINRWSNPNQTYGGYPLSGLVSGQTVYPNNTLTLNSTATFVANWRQSINPISGYFTNPTDNGRIMWPRTTLGFTASSSKGSITSVEFQAYYGDSWHSLGTDTTSADGWEFFWDTSGFTEGWLHLKTVVTDSAANEEEFVEENVVLSSTHITASGLESRASGRFETITLREITEETTTPPSFLTETTTETEASEEIETPPKIEATQAKTPRPAPVIPEPPQPLLHHKYLQTGRLSLE